MARTYHRLQERPNPTLLSVVIPIFNEQESVGHLKARLAEVVPSLGCPVELIVVNDGSTDRTLDLRFADATRAAQYDAEGLQ